MKSFVFSISTASRPNASLKLKRLCPRLNLIQLHQVIIIGNIIVEITTILIFADSVMSESEVNKHPKKNPKGTDHPPKNQNNSLSFIFLTLSYRIL